MESLGMVSNANFKTKRVATKQESLRLMKIRKILATESYGHPTSLNSSDHYQMAKKKPRQSDVRKTVPYAGLNARALKGSFTIKPQPSQGNMEAGRMRNSSIANLLLLMMSLRKSYLFPRSGGLKLIQAVEEKEEWRVGVNSGDRRKRSNTNMIASHERFWVIGSCPILKMEWRVGVNSGDRRKRSNTNMIASHERFWVIGSCPILKMTEWEERWVKFND
ncbi:hypothetical protein YC2023_077837 [Brassica napus]